MVTLETEIMGFPLFYRLGSLRAAWRDEGCVKRSR
jgi:hypothetical protein